MKKTVDIVFATNNKNKLTELERIFEKYISNSDRDIVLHTLLDIGFSGDIVEDGNSYKENAYIKASTVCKATGMITIGDDSGLEVDFLGGKPGIYSARYAGDGSSASNRKKLLFELGDIPYEKRSASFRCCICCCFPGGDTIYAEGKCDGYILFEERGEKGFGYDSLFYYPPFKKSFAELNENEKDEVSHRGVALKAFSEKISTRFH